jgi:uncharacterized phage-associated protein
MSVYRQKLINVVLFFAQETKRLNSTKLMKLLNFFDFEHFKQTGYPSIGLIYNAFPQGPVPKKFWLEVKDGMPPEDLRDKVSINQKIGEGQRKEVEFLPKKGAQVDFAIFTPREKEILKRLVFIYQDATAKTMSDISHEAEKPWEITIKEKGLNAEIDYLLAIDKDSPIDREEAEDNLRDLFLFMKSFDIEPVK